MGDDAEEGNVADNKDEDDNQKTDEALVVENGENSEPKGDEEQAQDEEKIEQAEEAEETTQIDTSGAEKVTDTGGQSDITAEEKVEIEENFEENIQQKVESTPVSAEDTTVTNNEDNQKEKEDISEKSSPVQEKSETIIEKCDEEKKKKEIENLEVKKYPEADKTKLRSQFQLFSRFGDKSSDGTTIKLSQSDKWFKQAGLFKSRGISTTDTAIVYKKISKGVPRLSFPAWCKYLNEISNSKKMDVNMIKHKLINCGVPGVTDTTKIAKSAAIERLTKDTAKFGHRKSRRVDSSLESKRRN